MQVADGGEGGAATAEIVHESLLSSWPRLKKWLDENQDDAAFLEQLRNASRQWQARGFPAGLLWRGEAMEEARLWHHRYKGDLPALQERYLEAVFSLAGRSARRKRFGFIAAIVFLSLLVAAAAVALVVISDTQREATAQAAAAKAAEQQVRDQFDEVEQAKNAAEAAQATAESERRAADEAREAAVQAKDQLQGKNKQLVEAVTRAEKARKRAEKSKRRERRQRRKARSKEREAREAAREAREAKAELERILEEERERIRKLEQEAGTSDAIDDVSID
jgi:flagellar biosynthesis GTPase FlhF